MQGLYIREKLGQREFWGQEKLMHQRGVQGNTAFTLGITSM